MNGDYPEALRDSFAGPAGNVRVLVIGDEGVGKTSLVHLLTEGQPISRPRVTIGCNVSVKYFEYSAGSMGLPGGPDSSPHRTFFIELWDVTGAPQYHAARPIFYQRINGVIAVHDLTNRRTRTNLHRWTSEVASLGTFSAPSPEATFPGGLPVPLLIIGNKSDSRKWDSQTGGRISLPNSPLKRVASKIGTMAGQLEARLSGFPDDESAAPLTKKATKWAAKLGEYVNGANGHDLPRADGTSSWTGLLTSAKTGKLDVGAVNAFFYELIRRRYFASEMDTRQPATSVPPVFPSLASGSDLDTLADGEASVPSGTHASRLVSETQVGSSTREGPYSLPPPPGRIRTSSSGHLEISPDKVPEPSTLLSPHVPHNGSTLSRKPSLPLVDPG